MEKYFKGVLQSRTFAFDKTHDSANLLDLCEPTSRMGNLRPDFKLLTEYAVALSFLGGVGNERRGEHAVRVATTVRETIRLLLQRKGLP